MAFNVVDQSYSGTYSNYFIRRANYQMDTIEKRLVYVVDGITKQHTIKRLDYKNPFKPRMATPTTDNANPFTMDGRLMIPKSVDIYEEFNPRDLEESDMSESLSTTILDRRVPPGLQSQMVQLVLNRAAEQQENGLWMGSLAFAGNVTSTDPRYQIQYFDGFLNLMVNDPLINLSSISPVAITTTNVLVIMNDLIAQATTKNKALITDKKAYSRMKFLMSPTTIGVYQQELGLGTTFKGTALNTGEVPRWMGYEVVRVAGMPDDTILFTRATNDIESSLFVGQNSSKDWDLRLMRLQNNSELFFIQGKFKFDVQYGWSEEIFLYTTLTPDDFLP